MIARECAWRLFAEELNSSSLQVEGKEREPSYIITPLGAKVNRILCVGVLAEKELVSDNLLKARVSDPTGVFTLYAGEYQKQALHILNSMSVPSVVAVIGKVKLLAQENVTFISLRPEIIKEVTYEIRDYWVLETCMHTKKRLELMQEALALSEPTVDKLLALGASKKLAEGIVLALGYYKDIEIEKYSRCIADSLHHIIEASPKELAEEVVELPPKPEKATPSENELKILELIKQLDTGKGASWEKLLDSAKALTLNRDEVEELVNALMDKGLVYEPILGRLKSV
ncbi:MAG: hypothetical protein QME47_01095 [Candidatus Thermoplasmatota archaeon]|nr:hypothetical protein [Candidatus Thermoplasmatota archaeon]